MEALAGDAENDGMGHGLYHGLRRSSDGPDPFAEVSGEKKRVMRTHLSGKGNGTSLSQPARIRVNLNRPQHQQSSPIAGELIP